MADMSVLQDGTGLTAGREVAPAYHRVDELLKAERCVILDGGIATELGRRLPDADRGRDEALWGTWALVHAPDVVRDVHRSYVEQGCDVISTNTWGLTAEMQGQRTGHLAPLHWMDIARLGVEVGREAIEQAGQEGRGRARLLDQRRHRRPRRGASSSSCCRAPSRTIRPTSSCWRPSPSSATA